MAQGDRPTWGAQSGDASFVKAFEHLDVCQFRQSAGQRVVERDLALFDQLHRRQAGDCLGHRGDPHHRVERHVGVAAENPLAERARIDDTGIISGKGDHARDVASFNRALEQLIDTSCD